MRLRSSVVSGPLHTRPAVAVLMGPFIYKPRVVPTDGINMGDGITVWMPTRVGGPHIWHWGDDNRPHESLICSCGWEMQWTGFMTPAMDRIWQHHRQGGDDT